jgi:hypothetical protein
MTNIIQYCFHLRFQNYKITYIESYSLNIFPNTKSAPQFSFNFFYYIHFSMINFFQYLIFLHCLNITKPIQCTSTDGKGFPMVPKHMVGCAMVWDVSTWKNKKLPFLTNRFVTFKISITYMVDEIVYTWFLVLILSTYIT